MPCANLVQGPSCKRRPASQQIPKRDAQRVDVGTCIDQHLSGAGKLLRTGKGRRANESGLRLIGGGLRDFGHAEINQLHQKRITHARFALPRSDHEIGRLEVAMHHAARFGGRQSASRLQDDFESEIQRQRPIAPHALFQRLAFDELHHVKALALLFAVVRDARDIRMMQLRRRARFPQEPRSHRRALRLSVDRSP